MPKRGAKHRAKSELVNGRNHEFLQQVSVAVTWRASSELPALLAKLAEVCEQDSQTPKDEQGPAESARPCSVGIGFVGMASWAEDVAGAYILGIVIPRCP